MTYNFLLSPSWSRVHLMLHTYSIIHCSSHWSYCFSPQATQVYCLLQNSVHLKINTCCTQQIWISFFSWRVGRSGILGSCFSTRQQLARAEPWVWSMHCPVYCYASPAFSFHLFILTTWPLLAFGLQILALGHTAL